MPRAYSIEGVYEMAFIHPIKTINHETGCKKAAGFMTFQGFLY